MSEQIDSARESRVSIVAQYPADGLGMKRMAQAALTWLDANKQTVNALNVFPVPDGEMEDVVAEMKAAIGEVETGEVTTATRDVEIDGVEVKEGQIIGLHNGKLIVSSEDLQAACMELLERIGTADYELVSLFYGERISKEESLAVAKQIQEAYPNHEIEVQPGGQPHYQFIFAIE